MVLESGTSSTRKETGKTRVQGTLLILRPSRLALLATRNGELALKLEDELFKVDIHDTDTKRMKLQKQK